MLFYSLVSSIYQAGHIIGMQTRFTAEKKAAAARAKKDKEKALDGGGRKPLKQQQQQNVVNGGKGRGADLQARAAAAVGEAPVTKRRRSLIFGDTDGGQGQGRSEGDT